MSTLLKLTDFRDMPEGVQITRSDAYLTAVAAHIPSDSPLRGGSNAQSEIADIEEMTTPSPIVTFPDEGKSFYYLDWPKYTVELSTDVYIMLVEKQKLTFTNTTNGKLRVNFITRKNGSFYMDEILELRPFMTRTR